MSFLTPLFLAGLTALGLPILFHLIRRTPSGRMPFSSVMFLKASPPRMTRRSRLENIPLLLLRLLALLLIAFAFARPFLRRAVALSTDNGTVDRVAVVVDVSASMRREDLWNQAVAKVNEIVRDCDSQDQVGVFVFDSSVRPVLTFQEWTSAENGAPGLLAEKLAQIEPGWQSTDLGKALVFGADSAERAESEQHGAAIGDRRVYLVSDLQQGAKRDRLEAYQWPQGVELTVVPVDVDQPTNAGLVVLPEEIGGLQAAPKLRVRVSNSGDADSEQFKLRWAEANAPSSPGWDAYVPPGQSRVVQVVRSPAGSVLELTGDRHPFDNRAFVAPARQQSWTVLYLGDEDLADSKGTGFFLKLAFPETRHRTVDVATPESASDWTVSYGRCRLAVVSRELGEEELKAARHFLQQDNTVLLAVSDATMDETLRSLLRGKNDEPFPATLAEADVDDYAMLSDVDFQHPVFAPLADARFSDFTKIHFWRHRRLETTADMEVLARFDGGAPALVSLDSPVGGKVFVLLSSWRPQDSELALSSKFVPLLNRVLQLAMGDLQRQSSSIVGASIPLTTRDGNTNWTVVKPTGENVELAADVESFEESELPGLYTLQSARGDQDTFAVNMDPAESDTTPLGVEDLERHGVAVAASSPAKEADKQEQKRQLLSAELESRQKLWRWLIVAALVVLVAETWLSGRTRPATTD